MFNNQELGMILEAIRHQEDELRLVFQEDPDYQESIEYRRKLRGLKERIKEVLGDD